ncbi:Pr6Pr family membrane protein [Phytomonospora endophytica]|uniref:Integral membrane regulator n=1 Tax=Phytomonospora endophytica TaxID=714109 RepID=A0A841FI47_9ACTN|nr:Pr6Pr family membrane protein [Phytomonospora endophytica]MBB6034633.1 hypothetical protein [Phytomonospora endophytica]GIG71307.1 hypothetical protein Pen01_76020 [Phytomonospora endophytica]
MYGKLVASYRLLFGLLTLGVFVERLFAGADLGRLLSFFTIQSNVIGGAVLVWGAVAILRGREESRGLSSLRGAAATYLITTGVVVVVLLSDVDPAGLDTPGYVDVVMHKILPVVMLIDWLIVPPANRLGVTDAATWLIYPLAYAAYTLIRGPFADWYPYPFIDPREKGYGHVAVMCAGITVWFVALAAALVRIGNLLRNRAPRTGRPLPTSPGR